MENIFYNCSLLFIPDISKWNVKNIKNEKYIFNSSFTYNSENIMNNSEYKKSSTNQISDFSTDENQKIIKETYKINDIDFNRELNDNYYENFYN